MIPALLLGCLSLVPRTLLPRPGELDVGDPAPGLEVAHWLEGEEVTTLAPGRVHVLEFWATWCGPCVAELEHLSALQEAHAERVRVIGLSDEPLQTVVRFLLRPTADGRRQGDRVRYALATDPDRSVQRAWFEAAGLDAIPAAFVIGAEGRVEWIGQPRDLDAVLDAVLAGTWDRAAYRAAWHAERARTRPEREARAAYRAAFEREDWEAALAALDVLIPGGDDVWAATKYGLLISRVRDPERASAYARTLLESAWDSNAWLCFQVAWITSGAEKFPFDDEHRDLDLALRAARRSVELDPCEEYLTMLAHIHAQRGEHAQAIEAQARAIAALEAARLEIRPEEQEAFEQDLARLRADLARYEELAQGH